MEKLINRQLDHYDVLAIVLRIHIIERLDYNKLKIKMKKGQVILIVLVLIN